MRYARVKLIAAHTAGGILKAPINRWLVGAFLVLIGIALFSAYQQNNRHQHEVAHYSEAVRERWEDNPDKHPHRMAHYGYVAFRSKTPLSFFDTGLDSYLGNVVFLEAHRQNAVNFSAAGQSSGLLRFGELSAGLLLQLLLPLLIFFWGFSAVADERERGILRLYLTQGVTQSEVIVGKSLGIFGVGLLIVLPSLLATFGLLLATAGTADLEHSLFSVAALSLGYLAYTLIMSTVAVGVSATSSSSKSALLKLIGLWLIFVFIVPKLSQVAAQLLYPSPSKIEFDTVVEEELIQQGDSHDPNDPHFKAIKDSLLTVYNVSSVKELPFNYGGFIMKEGERLSTEIYRKHQAELIQTYERQNGVLHTMALLNPYLALKQLSMTLSGTDFASYQLFKEETEAYRYHLAQTMNELQIKFISNTTTSSADKGATISRQYWKDFPPFAHRFLTGSEIIRAVAYPALALLAWLLMLVLGIRFGARHLKAL